MKGIIPSLRLFYGKELIGDVPLSAPSFLIGRRSGCALRLADLSVSKEHCRVSLKPGGSVTVEDLASTNGTFVNDRRIVKRDLAPHDAIRVSHYRLVFQTIEAEDDPPSRWWRSLLPGRRRNTRRTLGTFRLPPGDTVTEFDSVAYLMSRGEGSQDSPSEAERYLKRIPRLQVVARPSDRSEEVTRFAVSISSLSGSPIPPRGETAGERLKLLRPDVGRRRMILPAWMGEHALIPMLLILGFALVGGYFLMFQIDSELRLAEKQWDLRLREAVDRYRTLAEAETAAEPVGAGKAAGPMTDDAVWAAVDRKETWRDTLLFEVLDAVLSEEDAAWPLERMLGGISRMNSVTRRLPSLKNLDLMYSSEALPMSMEGLTAGRVFFLSTSAQSGLPPKEAWADYKKGLTASLGPVSACASARTTAKAGRVVLAFTVETAGTLSSVFVNPRRSTDEPALWACVREKLSRLRVAPPPGGSVSIVYTFRFAPPTRITF